MPVRNVQQNAPRSPSPSIESLPPHTSEIGTLKKLPDSGTVWLGSSSGVFFVNTVRRAFSAAFSASANGSQAGPPTEDILTGEVDAGPRDSKNGLEETAGMDAVWLSVMISMGSLPDRSLASELVMSFFKTWHPLFPFLHGPTFLKHMDMLYKPTSENERGTQQLTVLTRRRITFQLIINIAALGQTDCKLPKECQIKSTAAAMRASAVLAVEHNVETIQALIATELYLVASMALRQASTLAGMTLKLIFHSGLHRCPLRYAQLSAEDCEIRKRIFWSAYALDRHLSISLGDPNVLQDSDIDVCLSGRELHKSVSQEQRISARKEMRLHMGNIGEDDTVPSPEDPRAEQETPQGKERANREAALTSYVRYSRLIGRINETFHKSIHARFPKKDDITFLNSDIENWWNDLPASLSGEGSSDEAPSQGQLRPLFLTLYSHLLLLLNRPSLSLDTNGADFQRGLQVCIKAGRAILSSLKAHRANDQAMLLPGLLSANWMAGMIIAFSCQLGKYSKDRACVDIQTCLDLLQWMNSRWYSTKHCRHVLSLLLTNIQSRPTTRDGYLQSPVVSQSVSRRKSQKHDHPDADAKKRKTPRSLKRQSQSEDGPPTHRSAPSRQTSLEESTSASQFTATAQFATVPESSARHPPSIASAASSNDPGSSGPFPGGAEQIFQVGNPASEYTLYQNAEGGILPELPIAEYDPMFYQNFEFNMADVFNSASFENLTSTNNAGPPGSSWDAMYPP